jgi:hypothetical protein
MVLSYMLVLTVTVTFTDSGWCCNVVVTDSTDVCFLCCMSLQ